MWNNRYYYFFHPFIIIIEILLNVILESQYDEISISKKNNELSIGIIINFVNNNAS
jgi:hypothetical protein